MGRSVSYPSAAQVVTFNTLENPECYACDGTGKDESEADGKCMVCVGEGKLNATDVDFDEPIEDFRQHLAYLFPSVEPCDDWIDREDHVLAENKLARFGMSEYCGLVAYWIVPQKGPYAATARQWFAHNARAERWIKSISDKFVAAFGELTKAAQ